MRFCQKAKTNLVLGNMRLEDNIMRFVPQNYFTTYIALYQSHFQPTGSFAL